MPAFPTRSPARSSDERAAETAEAKAQRMPWFLWLAPVCIATADGIRFGNSESVSASAAITTAAAGLTAAAVLIGLASGKNKGRIRPGVPGTLLAWWVWVAVVGAVVGFNFAGLQNLLTYTLLVMGIYATYLFFERPHFAHFDRVMTRAVWVLAVVNGVQVFIKPDLIYGSRTAALVAAVALGWVATKAFVAWRPRTLFLPALLLVEIAASGSRTALALGFAILAISAIARGGRTGQTLFLFGIAGATMFYLATSWAPLRDRFAGGDGGFRVGGLALNTEGRALVWGQLFQKGQESPILGAGLGVAREFGLAISVSFDQPHNEYLRLFVDTGMIGLALLVAALLTVGFRSFRFISIDPEFAQLHASSVTAIVALMGAMATDNPLVYYFVLAPVAVIAGASLSVGSQLPIGLESRRGVKISPGAFSITCFASVSLLGVLLLS